MDLAALGLSVDSGPLSKAVQELRQVPAAARSAAAGADQVVGAAERMALAMTQSTAAANQNVRALQVVGSASRAAMQQMANSFAGVRDFDTGSLIAYGRELDGIRAKYNPLFAAGRQYRETLQDINVALKMGAISEKERSEAIARTKAEFVGQVAGINATSAALRGNVNALRAVAIQIPDVIQGIAMGQSGFQIFTQQGLQTVQVLGMQPGGIGGAFKELGKWAGAFLTPARLAAGGILAIGAAALTAAAQWQGAQRQLQTSLLGSGRASGATVGDLNQAASAGASTFGLSISEAREFAATLAQTGKVGVEEIGKIIKVGHDVATVYGIDATDASKLLAQSFADPVHGAEKLNERLGFLSARMQSDIASLVAQNRLYDAQRLLLSGVASSVEGAQTSLSGMAKGWAAVGNAISNAWGALGEWTSRALNMVPPETGKRIADLRREIESVGGEIEVRQHLAEKGYASNALDEAKVKYEMLREELERLVAQQEKYKKTVEDTQRATDSRFLAGVASRVIPEGQQLKDLKDQYSALKTALDKANASGGENSKIFSDLPFSYSQLATAVERAKGSVEGFKSEYEKTIASLKLDIGAVGAKGPGALGNVAYQRSLLQSGSNSSEAVAKAELDRTLAIKQAQQQILDTQKARLLSSEQATETAQMELAALGKSVAEQEAMRGKLAARQQLEQAALQTYGNRDAYDRAHLAALEKEVEKQAAIKQLLAEQQLKRDVKFQTDTLFMSSGDQQIAAALRNAYGDNKWKSEMDGALAQQMRMNDVLKTLKSTSEQFGETLIKALMRGENAMKALGQTALQVAPQLAMTALTSLASGNYVGAAISGAASIGAYLFGSSHAEEQAQQQAQQQALQARRAAEARQRGYEERVREAQTVTSDLSGALLQFEAKANDDRRAEAKAGGKKMAYLEQALAAEREKIITDFVKQAKEIEENLHNTRLGYIEREWEANNDNASLTAQLAAFDRKAAIEKRDAIQTVVDGLLTVTDTAHKASADLTLTQAGFENWVESFDPQQLSSAWAAISGVYDQASKDSISGLLAVGDYETARQEIIDEGNANILALDRALAAERARLEEDLLAQIAERSQSYLDRVFAASIDTTTLEGQLAAFDRRAAEERQAEIERGGEAIVDLDLALQVERYKIISDWNAKIVEEEKQAAEDRLKTVTQAVRGILEYVQGLYAGSGSTLSPAARLSAAQGQYQSILAVAQTGNTDALQSITKYADQVLEAARALYASSSGYQSIFSQVTSDLLGLQSVQETQDPLLVAMLDAIDAIDGVSANIITMHHALEAAVNTGSASAIATALSTYFNQIDTSVDGVIDFNEMKNALHLMASDAELATLFQTLDTDNSGSISRLDLIRQSSADGAAATVEGNETLVLLNTVLDAINVSTEQSAALQSTLNTLTAAQTDVLNSMDAANRIAASQLELLNGQLLGGEFNITYSVTGWAAGGYLSQNTFTATINNNMITALNKIVFNTKAIADNTRERWASLSSPGGWVVSTHGQLGVLASGGWITGGIPGRDSVMLASGRHIGMPGEYVVRKDVAQANASWIGEFNKSGRIPVPSISLGAVNDNSGLLEELRALRTEVSALRRDNNRVTVAAAEHVRDGVDQVTAVQSDANKRLRRLTG